MSKERRCCCDHKTPLSEKGRWVDTVYREADGIEEAERGSRFYTWEEYAKLLERGEIKNGVIEGGRTSRPR